MDFALKVVGSIRRPDVSNLRCPPCVIRGESRRESPRLLRLPPWLRHMGRRKRVVAGRCPAR
jgi:hypothetical protein